MAKLNALQCLNNVGNTGTEKCFFDPKNIIGAILTPKGYEIDVEALQTNLVAASHHVSKLSRIYPIYDFLAPKDSTEDKTVQTFPTGAKKVVREGYNDWSFQFVQGGVSLLKELRNFNGSSYDFLFVDADMQIIGIQGSSATKLKAVPSDGGFFWATPWKVNDGSKIAEYMIQFVFHVRYLTDYVAFVKADFDLPTTVKGLVDVVLTAESAGTAGSYKVTAKTHAGTNLAELYPTELAAADLWLAKNFITSNNIEITSVTIGTNAAGEACFVIACDTADTNYPAASAFLTLNLAAPAVLQIAAVDGYESTGAVKIVRNA